MYEYPGEDFFTKHFLKHRKVFVWGEINLRRSYLTINCLRYLSEKNLENVYIYINSDGGEIDSAIAIIDEIERLKTLGINVCTVVQGAAYSSAAFILMSGSKGYRLATPNSTILLHLISYGLDFESATKNKKYSDFADKQNETLLKLLAEYCGKNTNSKLKKFKEDIENDLWLSAKEAQKYGVIDSVADV